MSRDDQEYSVSKSIRGQAATFQVVPDFESGKLYLWLDPGGNPEDVVPFYRITHRDKEPIEQWHGFQEGAEIAPYAGENRAPLGAIEHPEAGAYILEAKVFTGLRTVTLPPIELEISAASEDADTADARAAFYAEYNALFQKFLDQEDTEAEARAFFDAFQPEQSGFLVDATVELGAPDDYANEEENNNVSGFFEFIDYVTALAHFAGQPALDALNKQPDSPTHRYYTHWVKQFLAEERMLKGILEKYPYCQP